MNSAFQVGITVLMNMVGVAFAITGIVMYSIDLGDAYFYWTCNWNNYYDNDDYGYDRRYYGDYHYMQMTTMPSVEKMRRESLRQEYIEKCNNMKTIAMVSMPLKWTMHIIILLTYLI